MKHIIKTILILSLVFVTGCTSKLQVSKLQPGEAANGIVYALPFTQFESEVTYFINDCGILGPDGIEKRFEIGIKSNSTPKSAIDPDHIYDIDPRKQNGQLKPAVYKISLHEDTPFLASINSTLEDQGSATVVSVAKTLASVYTQSAALGVMGGAKDDAKGGAKEGEKIENRNDSLCLDDIKKSFEEVKSLELVVRKLTSESSALEIAIASIKADIALTEGTVPETLKQKLADAIQAKKEKDKLKTAKANALQFHYNKISTKKTLTWPSSGNVLRSEAVNISNEQIKGWFKDSFTGDVYLQELETYLLIEPKAGQYGSRVALVSDQSDGADVECLFDVPRIAAEKVSEEKKIFGRCVQSETPNQTPIAQKFIDLISKGSSSDLAIFDRSAEQDEVNGIRHRTPALGKVVMIHPKRLEKKIGSIDDDYSTIAQLGVIHTLGMQANGFEKVVYDATFSKEGRLTDYNYTKTSSLFTSINELLATAQNTYIEDKKLRISSNQEKSDLELLDDYKKRLDLLSSIRTQEESLNIPDTNDLSAIDEVLERARQ